MPRVCGAYLYFRNTFFIFLLSTHPVKLAVHPICLQQPKQPVGANYQQQGVKGFQRLLKLP